MATTRGEEDGERKQKGSRSGDVRKKNIGTGLVKKGVKNLTGVFTTDGDASKD